MHKSYKIIKNTIITGAIICACFVLCLVIHSRFRTDMLIPAVFVLGTFLTSFITEGYIYGIMSALASVLAVNFAFTFPFFKVNFTIPENLASAVILIIITLMTCGLTAKLKKQEQIKAESEKERMRANLLRAISHDLRTPLTTIYGSSSALIDNGENFTHKQREEMLEGICQDAQWLSRMVENLLSITRLDKGNVKIIKTPTALDELIDSVLLKFAKRYPGCDVEINIPEDFVIIPMDAVLIEQVLINILENAVRHAKGMTHLELSVSARANKAVFKISDNGCGILPERMKNLFTGCYANTTSLSDRTKDNAGIGLSVCATIIKAHGGEIKAENAPSGGAVFSFSLDMEDLDDEQ